MSPTATPTASPVRTFVPFINEFHYDDTSGDAENHFVEIAAPIGADLNEWGIYLYAADGFFYEGTFFDFSPPLAESPLGSGVGFYSVDFTNTWMNDPFGGIAPTDGGIALIDHNGLVADFISYGGSFQAIDGPASGEFAEDVFSTEDSTTPTFSSIGRTGIGSEADDFVWSPLNASKNAVNQAQTFE